MSNPGSDGLLPIETDGEVQVCLPITTSGAESADLDEGTTVDQLPGGP